MNDEQLDTIENNMDELPQEALDFIFGDEVAAAKEELNENLDTDDQKVQLSNEVMTFLLGGTDQQGLSAFIDNLSIADEKKTAIKALIQDKIIDELIATMEAAQELEEETAKVPSAAKPAPIAPSPLASIADRLKQNSIVTPTNQSAGTAKPRTIDPYHEAIDA